MTPVLLHDPGVSLIILVLCVEASCSLCVHNMQSGRVCLLVIFLKACTPERTCRYPQIIPRIVRRKWG